MLSALNWSALDPGEFEGLCASLLARLNFKDVRRVGGAGDGGIDVECLSEVVVGPAKAEVLKWGVQCKHVHSTRGLRKDKLLEDLAKVVDSKLDFWMLMTSAVVSPGLAGWLEGRSRSDYRFRISYMDRRQIEIELARFPDVAMQFFDFEDQPVQTAAARVMALMVDGRVDEALEFGKQSSAHAHPRLAYLRACCSALLAAQSAQPMQDLLVEQAFVELERAIAGGFIAWMTEQVGWTRRRAVQLIRTDEDLNFIRSAAGARFDKICPAMQGKGRGSACVSGDAPVKMAAGGWKPARDLTVGDEVATFDECGRIAVGEVKAIRREAVDHSVRIAEILSCSTTHPILTQRGWVVAGDIRMGDLLVSETGAVVVDQLSWSEGEVAVVDVQISPTPTFIAAGIVVHNKLVIA